MDIISETNFREALFYAVFGSARETPEPDDIGESIAYLLKFLPEINREIIRLKFGLGKTYKDIERAVGFSREKARQNINSSLRMLRHPSKSRILLLGLKEYENRHMNGITDIEEIDLSTRAHTRLRLAGISTKDDLINFLEKHGSENYVSALCSIRGMGQKTAEEIIQKFGIIKK